MVVCVVLAPEEVLRVLPIKAGDLLLPLIAFWVCLRMVAGALLALAESYYDHTVAGAPSLLPIASGVIFVMVAGALLAQAEVLLGSHIIAGVL